jgi:PAP2 superfamily
MTQLAQAPATWPDPPDLTSVAHPCTAPTESPRPSGRCPRTVIGWARELMLLSSLYVGYMAARAAIGVHTGDAHRRGKQILDAEAWAHVDVERPLNALVAAAPPVGLLFAYLYATLHYVVTPAILVWIAARRGEGYLRARNGIVIATVVGLLGYWLLPTAPPRLLHAGFTDIMATFSDAGWWGGAASAPRGMEGLSDQLAAFPSLHVGWAAWVALNLRQHARSALVRRWAWTYPALMSLVVMGTANHYLLDALAGAACVTLGHWLAGRWETRTRPGMADSSATF